VCTKFDIYVFITANNILYCHKYFWSDHVMCMLSIICL
jgi:hypothetical protein